MSEQLQSFQIDQISESLHQDRPRVHSLPPKFSPGKHFPDGFCLKCEDSVGKYDEHMGVSKNSGTPKWMVYNGNGNPIKMDDLGVPICSLEELHTFLEVFAIRLESREASWENDDPAAAMGTPCA